MAEHKHWRKEYNSDYLGAWDLPENQDVIVQVKNVETKEIKGKGGRDIKPVMYFENNIKPLILNKTNCKSIEKALGTPYEDEWIGRKLQFYVDPAVSTPEGITSAVRIRDFAPEVVNGGK